MPKDRRDAQEPIELGEETLALVAGGSYRARSSMGGFEDEL